MTLDDPSVNVIIRRARPGDAHTLARLNIVVHRLHVQADPTRYKPLSADDPALVAHYEQALTDNDAHILIAERDGQPVGCLVAYLRTIPENPFVYSQRDFHIDQMVVDTPHQRQGIGQDLLEAALVAAKALGAEVATLGVASFNDGARRLYERHGFAAYHARMSRTL